MDYNQATDMDLWQCCLRDDLQAYTALFQRYFRSLYTFALKHTNNSFAAEELAMDVMYRFWEKRASIREGANLRAYLFTAVKRAVIDHWRKKELAVTDIAVITPESLPRAASTDAGLEGVEMEQLYQISLALLSTKEREVFLLSREEGLTYAQIAARMNISVNTVKTHMTSSLRTFRQLLSPHTDLIISLLFILYCHQ
ncbi:RNA polymerase sigma factor [Chitinophaga nivalis]|uniref:Sigma-70 family RNA polymerase sigma factor n=1 Tax=Chitinophaga nivalis TaxID=2991709 RepID=A0ABT3IQX0_9BACT|nr:sigma-70 family RNA polymerase sigma factor [Chitinophaga nivalis]MCW3463948.1 sigma-70 family RNA polymerase sigma factor [Chitinophaga nivalis]MCW3486362.1 sigma-70 family RNA polymerase sigma factor [Chitinophaga nivalis]